MRKLTHQYYIAIVIFITTLKWDRGQVPVTRESEQMDKRPEVGYRSQCSARAGVYACKEPPYADVLRQQTCHTFFALIPTTLVDLFPFHPES